MKIISLCFQDISEKCNFLLHKNYYIRNHWSSEYAQYLGIKKSLNLSFLQFKAQKYMYRDEKKEAHSEGGSPWLALPFFKFVLSNPCRPVLLKSGLCSFSLNGNKPRREFLNNKHSPLTTRNNKKFKLSNLLF